MSGTWFDPNCQVQAAFSRDQDAERKALFIRRLKADPELTLGQLRKRFGISDRLAKRWADEAGITIGRHQPVGIYRNLPASRRR